MASVKKRTGGLGKGLDSLIPAIVDVEDAKDGTPVELKISEVEPNKNQPRKDFDEEALNELTESIKLHGVISPIIVQKRDGYYEIVAGERRWRASKAAGLKKIPAIVREYSERELYEIALIENLQREDLNVVEEALAYKEYADKYELTQEELAARVSKSRTAVTNTLRLLKLEADVLQYVREGKLSAGHAKALLSVTAKEKQKALAEKAIAENLSVRDVEKLAKAISENKKKPKPVKKVKSEIYKDIEEKMKSKLGTKVVISEKSEGQGQLVIDYYSVDELDRIYELLMSIE